MHAYKTLKEDYKHLEEYCSDLKLQIREKELQAQIEIEKAIAKKERELRKEFEAEIRKADAENVRLQMEVEQLKKQSEK